MRWQTAAACRGANPELFYPGRGESLAPARAICAGCPVAVECAAAGSKELYGIWGGTSRFDRRNRAA